MSSTTTTLAVIALPSPSTVSTAQLTHLLSLYPRIARAVYAAKGKGKDAKWVDTTLGEDQWRYGGWKGDVEARSKGRKGKEDGGTWMELVEVEKGVRWKVTHGPARPFLPAQIRRNSPSDVSKVTSEAFALYDSTATNTTGPDTPPPRKVLESLMRLKGVGPATATLLLSVYAPSDVIYFSDEVYVWLVGGEPSGELSAGKSAKANSAVRAKAGGKDKAHLKYNLAEYEAIWREWVVLRARFERQGKGSSLRADDVEKAAYVLGNLAALGEEEQKEVMEKLGRLGEVDVDTEKRENHHGEGIGGDKKEKDEEVEKKGKVLEEEEKVAGPKEKGKGKRKANTAAERPMRKTRARK